MVNGFWDRLPRPFFALAPLANVTDAAFRQLIARYGKPDVLYTEFVSCDGLCSRGRTVLLRDLSFSQGEHPIVAQFFTARPEKLERCAALARELGFDGVDINMGCPDRNVEKQGAGAALMENPPLARELIRAAQAGAGGLPVSVKTRLGYRTNDLRAWLSELLAEQPTAVTIHARTRREMSDVPAHWEAIAEAVAIARGSGTVMIGNGDVRDLSEARRLAAQTGADGIMLGRAVFGNPWLFREPPPTVPLEHRLGAMVEHAELFSSLLGDVKGFRIMRKHYQAYAVGFPGARELRAKLLTTESVADVRAAIAEFMLTYGREASGPAGGVSP